MRIKLVSESYLKNHTAIEQNVSDEMLSTAILQACEVRIKPLLGESFYNHLAQAYVNETLTPEEEALLKDYIQPATAEWSYYHVFPHMYAKSSNKGVQKESSQWTQSSDIKEMKYIHDSISEMADLYSIRLTKELKRGYDAGYFPLAKSICDDNPRKSQFAYFTGIYLGDDSPIKRPRRSRPGENTFLD